MKFGFLINTDKKISKWITFAEQQGIEVIELMFNKPEEQDFENKKIIKEFQQSEVEPCACGLWFVNTMSPDRDEYKKNKNLATKFLDYTAELGSPIAFMSTGEYDKNNVDKNIEKFSKEYEFYSNYAQDLGISLAFYLGHDGNFIKTRGILKKTIKEIPEMKLKLDPVGIMRNLNDNPYKILELFGDKVLHFHVKDIYQNQDFEIEPPVGLGDLQWNKMLGLLYNFDYNGYVIAEPHGPKWSQGEYYWKHILLTKKHIEQFLI